MAQVSPDVRWAPLEYAAGIGASEPPILVAFDGSAAARQAVMAAARLLGPVRALVVTVWEPALAHATIAGAPDVSMAPTADPGAILELDSELQRNAERVAGEGAELARAQGLDAEPLAVSDVGSVPGTILSLAAQSGAAAIVVGSRGLGGIRARMEGSTSRGVVKRAVCPVLVVHDPADRD